MLYHEKNSFTSRNYTLTYYQTLEEAPWLLTLDKPKKVTKFSKTLKKFAGFFKKLQEFAMLKC